VSNLSRLQVSPELKEIKFKVFPSEEYSSKTEANIGRWVERLKKKIG